MKKTLLTIASVTISVCAFAQQNGKIAKNKNIILTSPIVNQSITAGKTATIGCDTLSTITTSSLGVGAASSDSTTPGCSPNAGYVYGTNCYGDLEKANFFSASTYSTLSGATVSGVIVAFFKSGNEGTGGVATNTVGMTLYNGTTAAAAPGSVIGSTVATLGNIVAAQTGTNTVFLYTFDFATPLAVSAAGGFYASLVLPNTPGDTAVVVNQVSAPANVAWEYWSDLTWHSISGAWSTNGNLFMLPKVCGNIVASVSENLGLSKNVTIVPNPTSGLINIAVILANKENLTISVSNTLGQEVISNKYNAITNDLISLDLSNFNNGVYFVTVSNGKDKMVQRLILNK